MTTSETGSGPTLKLYITVWIGLMLIVAVEAGLTYAGVSGLPLLIMLLVLAFFEAAIALRYFMHLKYEVPLLFWTLIPGLLLAFFMMNQFWADASRVNTLRFPAP
jgi:cytochrome c oxidase subunit IV